MYLNLLLNCESAAAERMRQVQPARGRDRQDHEPPPGAVGAAGADGERHPGAAAGRHHCGEGE